MKRKFLALALALPACSDGAANAPVVERAPDSPWPVAFTLSGDIITIETDGLDIDNLITYKIGR